MGFTLIKGTFLVLNYCPDGDSIRFQPLDRTKITGLQNGDRAIFQANGTLDLFIQRATRHTQGEPRDGCDSVQRCTVASKACGDGIGGSISTL